MPTKAKSQQPVSRPIKGKRLKAKAKFWVLWEPAARVLVVGIAMAIFASAGLTALRYGNAAQSVDDQQPISGSLLWADEPSSPVGSVITPAGSSQLLQHWRSDARYVYGGSAVKVVQDNTKNKALQFHGAAREGQADAYGNNQRAEQIADISLKKGGTYWFGFDVWVAPGSGVASGRQSIWEILSQPDKSQSKMWVALNSNQNGLAIETDQASLQLGSVPDEAWSRLVIGAHITDSSDAWLEVWRDGRPIVSRQSVAGGLVGKGASSGLMAAGLYRSPQPWDLTVRMANLKIATTREAVL
jgi:hypothetical protein